MAEGILHEAEQIVELAATETLTKEHMRVSNIVLAGTAAGSFVFTLGNTDLTITTGTNDLSKVIPINRSLNYLKLTSGPAGAALYAFLKKEEA